MESEKIQFAPPDVIGRADLLHVLRDLIDGILFRSQIVSLALAFGIAEVRRRAIVPHAARRFLAIVFAFHHRQARDLAAAFGADADIHELGCHFVGAAMGVDAAAMRVVLIHVAAQFLGVIVRDLLIAAFPDQDRRMIAVIDDHVAPGGGADGPGVAHGVAFAIHARLFGDDAEAVAGIERCRARRRSGPSG